VALPVRLQIPAIDVSTPLVKLGRLPDGSLEVPKAWDTAGWYDQGAPARAACRAGIRQVPLPYIAHQLEHDVPALRCP
jgi:hypothetical protein